jgi:hypothetical protein
MRITRAWVLSALASTTAFGALMGCGGDDDDTVVPSVDSGTDSTVPDACGFVCNDANAGGDATMNDSGDATPPGEASAGDASDSGITDAGPDTNPVLIPCSDASPCAIGSCCTGFCTDTTRDPQNCGACGNACSGTQFCNSLTCLDLILDNFCGNANATVVVDGLPADDDAGARIAAGFGQCVPSVTVHVVPQDGGVIDPTTSRPITGVGNTFAAAGGPLGLQHGIGYLDTQGLTPVHVTSSNGGATLAFELRDAGTVVSSSFVNLSATHDYFAVMVATEPVSGTFVLAAYGMLSPGTIAAGWYFQNEMVPSVVASLDGGADGGFPNAWYVYEWTDATANGPSADDTFTLLGTGF